VVALVAALLPASGAGGADTQAPKRGGTIVFAQPQDEPSCLNLLLEACAPGNSGIQLASILRLVLASPFTVSREFTWRPGLVFSPSIKTTPPFTLTYRIRSEARWSDGVPVTARDFEFTHEAILRYDSDLQGLHRAVRTVRAVDAKTVRVTLRSRLAQWRGLFGELLPEHALRGLNLEEVWGDRIDNPRTGRPIGSGPFLVERWERGKQLTLVRNPRYWGAQRARVERLVIRFGVQGAEVADALRRGELDVAYGYPYAFLDGLRAQDGVRLRSGLSTGWEHLDFRLKAGGHPLLRNKLVRRALALGIDRSAIVRRLTDEYGMRFAIRHSLVFSVQSPYYRPVWAVNGDRPQESRRLLERVGCRAGTDRIYVCNGNRLSFRFFTHVAPGSHRPGVVQQLQLQLRRIGVEIVPTYLPPGPAFAAYERGEFDAALFAWVQDAPQAGSKSLYGCGQHQNVAGYCQRLVTSDLDQAEKILDAERQAAALRRADARMAQDVPILPFFQLPVYAALADGTRGYVLYGHTGGGLRGAENWWLED
jgi:peptide/nickel transport system substrate-binding protein